MHISVLYVQYQVYCVQITELLFLYIYRCTELVSLYSIVQYCSLQYSKIQYRSTDYRTSFSVHVQVYRTGQSHLTAKHGHDGNIASDGLAKRAKNLRSRASLLTTDSRLKSILLY